MAGAMVTTNILQTLVAMGLDALREEVLMPRVVNREYEDLITSQKRGATVNVAVPSAITARVVAPDVVPPAVPAVTPTNVPITLTEWYEAPFAMDDKGIQQVQKGIIPMQASEAIKSIANNVDNFLWGKYKEFYGYAGVAGTTPFATDTSEYRTARKTGINQLMPKSDRFCLIDPDAEENALGLRAFQDASFGGGSGVILNGEIGSKMGAMWASTQNVPTHTAGTGTGYLVNNVAGYSVGDKTLTVDTGSGTILDGDIITFAGHTQTYAVASSVGGGTVTSITLYNGLQAAVANNTAITLKASHVSNLLLHRDAIAFASAPLTAEKLIPGEMIETAVDEKSGLSMRVELSRQHKQYQWSFDVLYGAAVVRPEFGVRIAG